MFILTKIAEQRIQEAMKNGEFDDLPGRGAPLCFEDDSHVPEDLRMAYKILKNANCVPPEISERKDIRQLEQLLDTIQDEKEKYKELKRLNFRIMRLNILRGGRVDTEIPQRYYARLAERLGAKAR